MTTDTAGTEAMTETVADRRVAEPEVPQSVIDAFENRYHNHFDLTRDDHEWRNTWRYKHDHVQSHWAGWRDSWLNRRTDTAGTVGEEAASSIDHQQRVGAPLTFYAHEADQFWRAEATRDGATTKDCMFAALQHLDELLATRSPTGGREAGLEP